MAYENRSAGFRHVAEIAACATIAIATVVLLGGWVAGVDALKTLGGAVPTKANTAICLIMLGCSMFLLVDQAGRGTRPARGLAMVSLVIGLVTLVEYVTGRALGIDELLFEDSTRTLVFKDAIQTLELAAPGRMAPQTAVAVVLTAIALIGLDWRPRGGWPAGWLAALVAALATLTLLGHIYNVASVYAVKPYIAMSAPVAAGFLLLTIGISCARPERGLVAALAADTTAGVLLRSLVPPALVVPLIVGTLVIVGERHGFYGGGEGVTLLVVATIFGCVTFALAAARTLQSLDMGRRRAESRLADQGRRYRTLVEQLPLITYVAAIDEVNTPLYVSPQVEATLGYSPDEWVADPALFEGLLHPDDHVRVTSGLVRFRESEQPFDDEYRLRRKDGRYVWMRHESTHVLDFFGQPLYAQGYMLDVTERKAAENERLELEAQLGEAQKLESLGRLAGGVAHDFRNLLGAIIAYAGFAQERAHHDPELLGDIAQIQRAAERGTDLTQELLVLGHKDVVQTRVMDLGDAVTEASKLLRPLLGDRHELRTVLDADPTCVEADPSQIQRLLINLAMNARAAMPEGGTVDVCTLAVVLEDDTTAIGLCGGEYIRLTVRDSGTGMSPDVVRRAFEPFFTTKPRGEGTGLGLSIVYGIAKRLGGHIEIESDPGRGTSVTVLLPVADSGPAAAPTEREPAHTKGHGEVVLVVDDDEALRRSTARILSSNGYAVREATDGLDALDRYADLDPSPAVLVTDVSMPRMTGPQLADAVLGMEPRTHVVFMSGYAEELEHVREDAPLVAKPFTADVLLTAVSQALTTESKGP